MNLNDAFKQAVMKYYDGFDYAEVNKSGTKKFEYDHKTLDDLHMKVLGKGKGKNNKKKSSEIAKHSDMDKILMKDTDISEDDSHRFEGEVDEELDDDELEEGNDFDD